MSFPFPLFELRFAALTTGIMEYWNDGFKRLGKSIYCRGLIYQARSVQFTHGFDESNPYHRLRIKNIEEKMKIPI
jgi:hypothetical protein